VAKAIAKRDARDIDVLGARLTGVGIEGAIVRPPTVDEFRAAMALIGRAAAASNWWVGDLSNYADEWGDEYVQLLDGLGLEHETVEQFRRVAHGVAIHTRVWNLSWTHHRAVYALTAAEQRKWLKGAQPKEGETTPQLSVSELKKAIRQAAIEERLKNAEPIEGVVASLDELIEAGRKFACIYADPPWQYGNQATRAATSNHYSTMSVDEVCEEPVPEVSAENCHLHLWTTNAFLFEAKRVMEAWGFEYKSALVWVKPQMGLGNYWRVSHEYLLLGVKGDAPFLDKGQTSWVEADRTKHSLKPRQVRERIEKVSPAPYLEMYGREAIPDWTVYGNQVEHGLFA